MGVTLLYNSPIYLVARATRLCSGTLNKLDSVADILGAGDKKLIENKVLQRDKPYDPLWPAHESVLEHAVYTYHLDFSRACLQELARHRISSPSVESTRWALKRILKGITEDQLDQFFHQTGDPEVDLAIRFQLWKVAEWSNAPKEIRKPNDIIKYAIPEAFLTQVQWTVNARSMRNWMVLRTSSRALKEIRDVAFAMAELVPEEHKFLFSDRIHEREVE